VQLIKNYSFDLSNVGAFVDNFIDIASLKKAELNGAI